MLRSPRGVCSNTPGITPEALAILLAPPCAVRSKGLKIDAIGQLSFVAGRSIPVQKIGIRPSKATPVVSPPEQIHKGTRTSQKYDALPRRDFSGITKTVMILSPQILAVVKCRPRVPKRH